LHCQEKLAGNADKITSPHAQAATGAPSAAQHHLHVHTAPLPRNGRVANYHTTFAPSRMSDGLANYHMIFIPTGWAHAARLQAVGSLTANNKRLAAGGAAHLRGRSFFTNMGLKKRAQTNARPNIAREGAHRKT
jgi:hypothetical protein